MKITISKQHLTKALAIVNRFCAEKEKTFTYDSVQISLLNGHLCLFATNYDTEITYLVKDSLKINRRSKAVIDVSGRTIKDVIKGVYATDPVTLEIVREKKAKKGEAQKPDYLCITTKNLNFRLNEKKSVDRHLEKIHPPFEPMQSKFSFAMLAKELREILARVCYLIPNDDFRYYINGLFIHRENRGGKKYLRVVVTDGHRLAVVERPLPAGMGALPICNTAIIPKRVSAKRLKALQKQNNSIKCTIIPRLVALEVQRLIAQYRDKVYANFGEDFFRFHWNTSNTQIVIQSKYLEGTYPNYKQVLPKEKYFVQVDAYELREAMDIFKSKTKLKMITFNFGKKLLRVAMNFESYGKHMGDMVEEVGIKPGKGMRKLNPDPMIIGLNKFYVEEHLKHCSGDTPYQIGFTDPGDPVSFRQEEDYYYLVMPMRI